MTGARAARWGLLVVGLLAVRGAAAAVDPCPRPWEAAAGPLPAGTGPADFGAIPEACPGADVSLRLRGVVLVASDAPDFYGSVAGAATLRLRRPLGASRRTWFSVAADLVTYRYVVNAVLPSGGASVGPPTAGLYRALGHRPNLALAVYGRVLLPLDTARRHGVETGLELGAAMRLVSTPGAGLDAGLALAAPLDLIAGQAHGALQPAALVELWFQPVSYVGLAGGATARMEAAPDPALIAIAPRLSARFALRHRLSLAALAEAPIGGADRTDLVAAVFLGWSP